jgi:hypothetical protein
MRSQQNIKKKKTWSWFVSSQTLALKFLFNLVSTLRNRPAHAQLVQAAFLKQE